MSRRREKSPGQEKPDSLSPSKMRELIKKYGIEFKGVLTPSQWPPKYSKLFLSIREIGFTEFDKYLPDATDNRGSFVDKMKARAEEMVEVSRENRQDLVGESTLRMNIEPLVFARLRDEVKCLNCFDYLWLAEYSALPSNPLEAEKLERRRAERSLCHCSPSEQRLGKSKANGSRETRLFKYSCEAIIKYHESDGLEKRGVQRRKPDRMFGLTETESIQYYSRADSVKGLRHSPFPNEKILYPFLIVEAKPEGGPGFESIETQTAFPIRTCVKLQVDLQRRSGISLDPLVWFIAYEGDIWRVSACIKNEGKYQVIDLWMGRVTSRDGALQLLHMIDTICVWARDEFRFQILCCLGGGKEKLRHRHVSPAATYTSRFSTQELQLERAISRQGSVGVLPNIGPEIIDLTDAASVTDAVLQDTMMVDLLTPVEDERDAVESYPIVSSHPLMRWANVSNTEAPWTKLATIRHSNMISFCFLHFSVSGDLDTLVKCLDQASSSGAGSARDMAIALASSFMDDTCAMATTTNRILQLKEEWLKKGTGMTSGSETPVRVLFSFRTYVRSSDWQIVRELRCVSCTPDGLHGLTTLAGVDLGTVRPPITWPTELHPFSSSCFSSLHSLAHSDSAAAAINSTVLYLVVKDNNSGQDRCKWVDRGAPASIIPSFALLGSRVSLRLTPTSVMDRGNALMEVLDRPLPKDLKSCLGSQLSETSSAILLRKGSHWPSAAPSWCLLVFDEVDFEERRELAKIVVQAKDEGFCYTFSLSGSRDEPGEPTKVSVDNSVDEKSLDWWIESLRL